MLLHISTALRTLGTSATPNLPLGWLEWYYICTYALAAIALGGSVWSIVSSKKTAKTIERTAETSDRIQRALGTMVEPFLKVTDHVWLAGPSEKISCEHPPVGVIVGVRNHSNVPIQVYRTSFRTFLGDLELNQMVQNTQVAVPKTVLLAPGELLQLRQVQPTEFPKYLRQSGPPFGPQFTIQLEVEFDAISGSRRRIYQTRQFLHFDCNAPDALLRTCLEESVTLLSRTITVEPVTAASA